MDDGVYTFVVRSKFAYEDSQVQETRMSVKLDGTAPTVNDIAITEVEEGYEITLDVFDENRLYKLLIR